MPRHYKNLAAGRDAPDWQYPTEDGGVPARLDQIFHDDGVASGCAEVRTKYRNTRTQSGTTTRELPADDVPLPHLRVGLNEVDERTFANATKKLLRDPSDRRDALESGRFTIHGLMGPVVVARSTEPEAA